MIEIIIGVLGLIIAWITYVKTFHSKPNEEKESFLALFRVTQSLSKELSVIMTNYANKKNAWNSQLYEGITYKSFIEALKESQSTNLSNELFEKLKATDFTKSNIALMQQSLQAQHDDLQKMKSLFLLASKSN
jgi:UDP-N-acetyl-D-mannosaminuronate dehydrogenase